jgi:hypothetical protein
MDNLEFVTYCGLHCDLCSARSRIPQRARGLQQAMADEGWPYWGRDLPGFPGFWAFLEGLQAEGGCPGCRAGGGDPGCRIRVCARERRVTLCNECSDFPCEHVEALAARYPALIADNGRMRAVGLDQWLEEQRERVRRGFIYTDIRYRVERTEE